MINRRHFLAITGVTLIEISTGLLLNLALADSTAPTLSLSVFNKQQAETLLHMSRTLFPHNILEDKFYLVCVESFDKGLSGNASIASSIQTDLTNFINSNPSFVTQTAEKQLSAINAIENMGLFASLKQHLITALYNNPDVWPLFGYEGASFPKGGYLERGFDDIDWLPEA